MSTHETAENLSHMLQEIGPAERQRILDGEALVQVHITGVGYGAGSTALFLECGHRVKVDRVEVEGPDFPDQADCLCCTEALFDHFEEN